ncbi:universal stress protein [Actinomadura rudentiformis]|uniref:Universal stress protein n=1 Tax=Actinomadura rudentiformis TaxID=359158 RepID=A0A6H9YP18_9ACTN|nr:universal stress protein [Actinomadura rudentiformis]KAB2347935.1 universal stress protein [Actinomadura rudentiformis]
MTILIAYDGSDDAKAAIDFAGRHVSPAPAVVLVVWEPLLLQIARSSAAAPPAFVGDDAAGAERRERQQAERFAAEGAELARRAGLTDVIPRAESSNGPIWATIVNVADEIDATLVVTGTRGLARVKSVLLGSVSDRVLHHVKRPVLIVPHVIEDAGGRVST